jgi:uncharacterized protein (DUF608 family)
MGGLGTGSVEIRADGHFHQWQIMNNHPWGNAHPTAEMDDEGLFFGVAALTKGKARVMMLSRERWGDNSPGFSWEDLRWMTDPYHMPWMDYPEKIEYEGRHPFANLAYKSKDFPVSATLEAFSPFIPLDSKNSGLPVAFMTFTLANRTRIRQRVALFGALKNCVGYEHPDNDSVISFRKSGAQSYLEFGRKGLADDCQSAGGMTLGVWSKKAGRVSYVLHGVHPRDLYDPIMSNARLEDLDRSVFRGSVGNDLGGPARVKRADVGLSRGLLCKTLDLAPGEKVEVTFALTWHVPNMAEQGSSGAMEVIGHQYSNWFSSAADVAAYAAKNFPRLRERSMEFADAFYGTTVKRWMLDAVNAQLTSFTKSTWWDRQGRFAVWEGLGCCGLQTLDISLYGSFPIILFFPELEKSQMRIVGETAKRMNRPPHLFHASLSPCCSRPNNRIDNAIQFILLAWRDALWTGDKQYVKELWPAVETYLKDIAQTDTDGDGLPNNSGVDQSYDQFPLYGTSAYVGLQFVGAIKAASSMARMMGNVERAEELEERQAKALEELESQLWNGEYYALSFDKVKGSGNAGCMADQLCGDWFVRQTDGVGLIGTERARLALEAVFKYCMRGSEYLSNCEWPRGGRVRIRRETSDQANCPWTGVEFAVASEMILLGLAREGGTVLRGVWERYERFGMRYNHVECGTHYYRALGAWAVYLALLGFAWDAGAGRMTLRLARRKARFVWNTPSAWGYVTFRGAAKALAEIEVVRGTLTLGAVSLTGGGRKPVKVRSAGKTASAATAFAGDTATVQFAKPLRLGEGARVTLTL